MIDGQTATYAANKAIQNLLNNGQIGGIQKKTFNMTGGSNLIEGYATTLGMKVNMTFPGEGYCFLSTPPNEGKDYPEFFTTAFDGDSTWFVSNHNHDIFSRNVFVISGDFSKRCPTFSANYPNADTLLYVYQDTEVARLGITVPKGWYASNQTTFTFEPFDIEANPFVVDDFTATFPDIGNLPAESLDVLKGFFLFRKRFSFVVSERNTISISSTQTLVCFADVSRYQFGDDAEENRKLLAVSAFLESTAVTINPNGKRTEDVVITSVDDLVSFTITYEIAPKTIDPKFLPNNTLGEDVWGSHIETAFLMAMQGLMSSGSKGYGVATFRVDDWYGFSERCKIADKMRWGFETMLGSAEANISAKAFNSDGTIAYMSAGAIVAVPDYGVVVDGKILVTIAGHDVMILVWLSTLDQA